VRYIHLSGEIATAFFFSASIGIGASVALISFTHRLSDGLMLAPLAFLLAGAVFGLLIWRNYRPAPRLRAMHPHTIEVARSASPG
jgi:hypothetical protein